MSRAGDLAARADAIALPAGFFLGAATSAYQVEGAWNSDGKGESIWDRFCRKAGAICDGSSGDVACDHYRLWHRDLDLIRDLGLQAYRFSIAWPRIQPDGNGPALAGGLAFYDRLTDALLAAGITPYPTLYHWDLPQALQDRGGWYARDTAHRFSDYAALVAEALCDRIDHWTTLNEPWTFCWSGHATGEDAPGLTDGMRGGLAASHHALLGHGLSVAAIRAVSPGARVGIVLDINTVEPASDRPEDRAAAHRFEGVQNRWYLDALFKGTYPQDIVDLAAGMLPDIRPGDLATIAAPLDFLGINTYRRSVIGAGADLPPLDFVRHNPPGAYTATGWEIHPPCIRDALSYVHRGWAPGCLLVTENGMATPPESPGPDGAVNDPDRAAYILDHLQQVLRARAEGVPVTGYFAWTLLDNFEWALGYSALFGITHVDFATQERTPKLSARLLSRIAQGARP